MSFHAANNSTATAAGFAGAGAAGDAGAGAGGVTVDRARSAGVAGRFGATATGVAAAAGIPGDRTSSNALFEGERRRSRSSGRVADDQQSGIMVDENTFSDEEPLEDVVDLLKLPDWQMPKIWKRTSDRW